MSKEISKIERNSLLNMAISKEKSTLFNFLDMGTRHEWK
jgi:hypothetical protein